MSRKMLTFVSEVNSADSVRVFWSNGICKTIEAFEKVMAGGYLWESIKTTGLTWEPTAKRRFVRRKINANDERFLGIQNPPKVKPQVNEVGEVVEKKVRKASGITIEVLQKMQALAEQGKTLKEAEAELGVSYSNLFIAAKKNQIVFKAGQRGRKKIEKSVDTNLAA